MNYLTTANRAILESTLYNLRLSGDTDADALPDPVCLTDAELEEAVNSALITV